MTPRRGRRVRSDGPGDAAVPASRPAPEADVGLGAPQPPPPTARMQTLRGIAVSPGIAIGPASVVDLRRAAAPRWSIAAEAVPAEFERLDHALGAALAEVPRPPWPTRAAGSARSTPTSSAPTPG